MAEWRWEDLVAHATLGTGRRPDVGVHTVAGHPVDGPTPEARLLSAAAAMAAGVRASVTATQAGPVDDRWIAPAHEPLAVAPDHAVQLLDALLSGLVASSVSRGLLVAWLEQAATAGWRVPDDRIGAVLDASPVPLPAEAVAALGLRGRWLARIGRSAWSHRLVDVATAVEVLGRPRSRVAVRAAVVRLWADAPDRGRAAVAQRWEGWDSRTRSTMVDAVHGLAGLEDEGWLEGALDDVEAVATAAARNLRGVPGSALVSRMGARLGGVVTVEAGRRGLLGGRVPVGRAAPVVRAPESPVRPGPVDLRDAMTPVAERAVGWWAQEVRRAAPLQAWVEVCGSREAAIAAQTQTPAVLLDVAVAATAQQEVGWATDLLPGLLAGHAVPREDGPAWTVDIWAQDRWTAALVGLLDLLPTPWPAALTADVIAWIGGHPRPADALRALTPTLVRGPGVELDDRLADARPSGATAAQIATQIRTIQTARSLARAIRQMDGQQDQPALPTRTQPHEEAT